MYYVCAIGPKAPQGFRLVWGFGEWVCGDVANGALAQVYQTWQQAAEQARLLGLNPLQCVTGSGE